MELWRIPMKRKDTMAMPEKLWSVKQVADYLGVSTRTVQTYVNEQDPELRLNGIYLGNRWRFEEKDVKDFIERRRKFDQASQSIWRRLLERPCPHALAGVRQKLAELHHCYSKSDDFLPGKWTDR